MSVRLSEKDALAVAGRAAGFREVKVTADWDVDAACWDFCLDVDEFSLVSYTDGTGWQVIVWTGAYPFANDVVMADLKGTVAEALRYVRWLQKREAFYVERDERLWKDLG